MRSSPLAGRWRRGAPRSSNTTALASNGPTAGLNACGKRGKRCGERVRSSDLYWLLSAGGCRRSDLANATSATRHPGQRAHLEEEVATHSCYLSVQGVVLRPNNSLPGQHLGSMARWLTVFNWFLGRAVGALEIVKLTRELSAFVSQFIKRSYVSFGE